MEVDWLFKGFLIKIIFEAINSKGKKLISNDLSKRVDEEITAYAEELSSIMEFSI